MSSQRTATYKYDYAGRRVRKAENGGQTTVCCYDGDQIIAEFTDSGGFLRRYFYGQGIDEPIAMQLSGPVTYYYHYDGLGSVVAISNANRQIVERYDYNVFGSVTIRDAQYAVRSTSAYGNTRMFTGREFDSESGLYYYRARYYSPALGRFLQTDPIGYYYSMNLYEYCWNNPLNWVDPSGLTLVPITPDPEPGGAWPDLPGSGKDCPPTDLDQLPVNLLDMPGLPPYRLPPKLPNPKQRIPYFVPGVKDPGYPTPIPGRPIPQLPSPSEPRETWWSLVLQLIESIMKTDVIIIVPAPPLWEIPNMRPPPRRPPGSPAWYFEQGPVLEIDQAHAYC